MKFYTIFIGCCFLLIPLAMQSQPCESIEKEITQAKKKDSFYPIFERIVKISYEPLEELQKQTKMDKWNDFLNCAHNYIIKNSGGMGRQKAIFDRLSEIRKSVRKIFNKLPDFSTRELKNLFKDLAYSEAETNIYFTESMLAINKADNNVEEKTVPVKAAAILPNYEKILETYRTYKKNFNEGAYKFLQLNFIKILREDVFDIRRAQKFFDKLELLKLALEEEKKKARFGWGNTSRTKNIDTINQMETELKQKFPTLVSGSYPIPKSAYDALYTTKEFKFVVIAAEALALNILLQKLEDYIQKSK